MSGAVLQCRKRRKGGLEGGDFELKDQELALGTPKRGIEQMTV